MRGNTTLLYRGAAAAALAMLVSAGALRADNDSPGWRRATPVLEVNSPDSEGCPIESRDGLSLYFASNRANGLGANDIWASDRAGKADSFGAPQNLGAPVNSNANDFCPTPVQGSYLLFVSERPGPETCNAGPGNGDIYIIRRNAGAGWGAPRHLGCVEDGTGPNSANPEFSPSLVTTEQGTVLYFSSGVPGSQDIYASRMRSDGTFGRPKPIREVNTDKDDRMPNVRADGLEMVFSSTRATDANGTTAFGNFDVYVSHRSSTRAHWSAPINLGDTVNTAGSETRATMSWDGRRLYFGRDGDIYTSKRRHVPDWQ